jgi:hypothetical protein
MIASYAALIDQLHTEWVRQALPEPPLPETL